jgi:hypothetical protein
MEDDFLTLGCAGALLVVALIILVLVILGLRPYTIRKKKEGSNTCLTIRAKRNLAKVTVVARLGDEEVTFERKRIRKGQSVDFVFPSSDKKAKLIVEVESGNARTAEV